MEQGRGPARGGQRGRTLRIRRAVVPMALVYWPGRVLWLRVWLN